MALAALGVGQRASEFFDGLYSLKPEGEYELLAPELRRRRLEGLINLTPRSAAGGPSTEQCDFAAGLQSMLIRVVEHVLRHFQRETGALSLAFAGGVAHNCALASHLLEMGVFREVFVQPAAHDAGGALGAAISAYLDLSEASGSSATSPGKRPVFSVLTGSPLPEKEALLGELLTWKDQVSIKEPPDIFRVAAREIVDGKVVGWVRGRSEFGPRALGNRSILASTSDRRVRDRINREIKEREDFQPFAPAVMEEAVWDLFEQPPTQAHLGFMTYLLRAKREVTRGLFSVLHEDDTARVQVVSRDEQPDFHSLIAHVDELSGIPAVLNTSFNRRREPIVDSVYDAVSSFLLSGLDRLFIGQFEVRRTALALGPEALAKMCVELPGSSKVVWRSVAGRTAHSREFFLETTYSRHLGGAKAVLTRKMGEFLQRVDGQTTCSELQARAGDEVSPDYLYQELLTLWKRGLVRLRPV